MLNRVLTHLRLHDVVIVVIARIELNFGQSFNQRKKFFIPLNSKEIILNSLSSIHAITDKSFVKIS